MTFVAKKAPPPSLHLLGHPESDADYQHFTAALDGSRSAPAVQALPFDHTATAFSPINAWWLADAALLAYWDPSSAAQRFEQNAGLASAFFSHEGTQCYVASNDRFAVVTFRGTQPGDRADAWTDMDFIPRPWEGGGDVHQGFMYGLNAVWADVRGYLKQTGAASVWFTGHSLGAALAVLAADRFESSAGVYTIGSPRVGNLEFVRKFNQRHANRSFRYVNHHDVVTRLPPSAVGFVHVDEEKYFDSRGVLKGGAENEQDAPGDESTMSSKVRVGVSGASLIPRALVDHTPRLYATYAWNAIVAALEPQR